MQSGHIVRRIYIPSYNQFKFLAEHHAANSDVLILHAEMERAATKWKVKTENTRVSAPRFSGRFLAHVYFQSTINRSENLVDFLPSSIPFCAFSAKWHETGKIGD